jgi:hypothetical protein
MVAMRCVAGFALFVILYFSSCTILRGAVERTSGPWAAADAVRKYHALVAVAAGAVSLTACVLPGVLLRKSREADLRDLEAWNNQA